MRSFIGPLTLSLALASVTTSLVAHADDLAGKRRAEARARFDRALALADEGDLDRALAEFQRAYDLIPNGRVLLNIAEAQAALGRPADAVTSLDKVLADVVGLRPAEVASAKALRAREIGKVAELKVTSNVDGARVEIDNIEVATTPVDRPLRVSSGQRIVSVIAAGHAPMRKTITIAGGTSAALEFDLVPLDSRLAHLSVKSSLPGAQLSANGQAVATTPVPTTLTFAPGRYRFELTRPGYTPAAADLDLGEGATGELRLDPQLDERALATSSGTIEIAPSEPGATVAIDGRMLGVVSRAVLPPGPHAIKVEKGGFLPYERTVSLSAERPLRLSPWLVPTAETRAAHVSSARRSRALGWGLAAGGGAVLATSGVLAVVFTGRRSDAQSTYDATVARAEAQRVTGQCGDVCLAEFDDADAKLKDAKLLQTASFVGVGVGALAAGLGAYLLVSGEDPRKYDHPPKSSSLRVRPELRALTGGAAGGLSGTF